MGLGPVSCGVDPDEQTLITIEGLDGYDGLFANVTVYDTDNPNTAKALGVSRFIVISGGVAKQLPLVTVDEKAEAAKAKTGAVVLAINEKIDGTGDKIYVGQTTRVIELGEGEVTLNKSQFTPPIPDKKPSATNYGTYKTVYSSNSGNVTETIVLAETTFKIYDDTQTDPDFLEFAITAWEPSDPPTDATGYTGGYKFTGKITGQKGYCPSPKTAPGFSADDAKADKSGPECWMYIYFKGETSNITFVRSPFNKAGSSNKGIVTGSDSQPRVYTKQ